MSSSPIRGSRVVFDTNVLISAALARKGTPRKVVDHVLGSGIPLLSAATHGELVEVIERPHLQRYLSERFKVDFLRQLVAATVWIEPAEEITTCRDPKDDKFLEVAVSGKADYLVSGDQDLLVLHPFRGVQILTPAAFLETVETKL